MEVAIQTRNKPLYPNILWGRPERRSARGTVLIIGGNSQEFVDVQTSYAAAQEIGVGKATVVLPHALHKLLSTLPDVEFASSGPSGGFDSDAFHTLISLSNTSDVMVLSGELSNNSETHIVVEKLVRTTDKPVVLVGDSIMHSAPAIAERNHPTIIVGSKRTFQELIKLHSLPQTITATSTPQHIRSSLHELAIATNAICVLHNSGSVYAVSAQAVAHMKLDTMNHPRTAVFIAEFIAEFPAQIFGATVSALAVT